MAPYFDFDDESVDYSFSEADSEKSEYEEDQDEVFYVPILCGPKKDEIRIEKTILNALLKSSPKLDARCRQTWQENYDRLILVSAEEETDENQLIYLPEVDKETFETVLELITHETVTDDDLDHLEIDELLNLVDFAKFFEIPTLKQVLTESLSPIFMEFDSFCKTPDFLSLSRKNLLRIISSEDLAEDEIIIFIAIFRWALRRVYEQKLEKTHENLRSVLGDCLFQIRFPRMAINDFGKHVVPKNILTGDEVARIVQFMCLDDKQKDEIFSTGLGNFTNFRLEPRKPKSKINVPCLTQLYDNSYFVKSVSLNNLNDTITYFEDFNVDKKIAVMGLAFPGPMDYKAEYDVIVEIKVEVAEKHVLTLFQPTMKRIAATPKQPFFFLFDEPVVWDPSITNPAKNYPFMINITFKGLISHHVMKKDFDRGHATQNEFEKEIEGGVKFKYVVYTGMPCILQINYKQII